MKSLQLVRIAAALIVAGSLNAMAKMGSAETSDSKGETLDHAVNAPMGQAGQIESGPTGIKRGFRKHLSLAAGSTLLVSNETVAGVGLSALYRLGEPDSNSAIELGGMLPATAPTDFESVHQVINGDFYTARIDSLAEAHAAVRYGLPHGRQKMIVPDMALGVSVLQIKNEINVQPGLASSTPFINETNSETTWSPLLQLGFRLFPHSRLSFRFDAAYVHYGNTPTHGASFDLGVSGWMLRPMLQIQL